MRVLIAEHDHPVYARLLREAAPDLEVLTSRASTSRSCPSMYVSTYSAMTCPKIPTARDKR